MADQETSACPECGVTFTLRQATGSCQRCIKLAVHERGSAGYKDIDKWPQCMMCGITLPNMRVASEGQIQTCPGAKCVSKARGELDPPSTASAAPIQHGHRGNSSTINDATMARTDSVRDRMKLQPALYQIGNSAASGTIHSTQSLLEHQNGGGSVGELMIAVGWQARNGKSSKLDTSLGAQLKQWAGSVYMTDVTSPIYGIRSYMAHQTWILQD